MYDRILIEEASNKYGSQAVVISIDTYDNGKWFSPYVLNGKIKIDFSIKSWAQAAEKSGAGEILLTSINFNGLQKGYDEELYKIYKEVKIPIIINGGCGEPQHMIEAIKAGASAVAASTMFLFTEHTPRSCAQALHAAGVPVRL